MRSQRCSAIPLGLLWSVGSSEFAMLRPQVRLRAIGCNNLVVYGGVQAFDRNNRYRWDAGEDARARCGSNAAKRPDSGAQSSTTTRWHGMIGATTGDERFP